MSTSTLTMAPTLNYDFICYPLKSQFFDRLEHPLQKDIQKIYSHIKASLISSDGIKANMDKDLKLIFSIRVRAIKWFLKKFSIADFNDIAIDSYNDFDVLASNPKYVALWENLKYALRCNKRFLEAFMEHAALHPNVQSEVHVPHTLPEISYDQFVTAIAMGVPDDATSQRIIDLVNSSLYIEYIMIAASIIVDEKSSVSKPAIKELTVLIADAAHNYSAICYELGILRRGKKVGEPMIRFDTDFIEEQSQLADLGINDLIEA